MTKEEKPVAVRVMALECLMDILEKELYSDQVLHAVLTKYQYMEKKDRAFLSRLVEGTVERKIELDYILDRFSKVKVKKMKPVIRNILRLSLYQIMYMDHVPERAVLSEALKLAEKKGFHSLKGFVNGVLRNIARNMENISYPDKEKEPVLYYSVVYSMPEWIVEMWIAAYGEEVTESMLASFLEEKETVVRCNITKQNPKELKQNLEQEEVTVKAGSYLPYAYKISNYNYLRRLKSFKEGQFQVQDESSMLVAEFAGIKDGDYVIDVCAAPGGKTTHAAEILQGSGKVSSRDISYEKTSLIEENAERLGLSNIEVLEWDAEQERKEDIGKADVVLADLPCSGLGVIGKKCDIKYKADKERIRELMQLQRRILQTVQRYVKPGGVLIYSTCTVQKEENEENADWFASQFPFEIVSVVDELPEQLKKMVTKQGYVQLVPGQVQTDGFFFAKFRRLEES